MHADTRTCLIGVMADPYDLDKAWEEVLNSFEKTARVKLQPDHLLTPQEVIDQLKTRREQDEDAKRKHQGLRNALHRTLECIKTLGTIASMDQSQVLGPSNLVYCAIVFLIQAGFAYLMMFERMEELFTEMADILERFDVYRNMRDVDLPLRKIVHGLLQSMVSICALSLKVLNGNKITKYLKVLAFNEDEGIQAQLLALRKIVEREAVMSSTLTYRNVKEGFENTSDELSGVRKAVDHLSKDISRRENESVEHRQMDLIKTRLGVYNAVEHQRHIQEHLLLETVAGTGVWLREDASYRRWTETATDNGHMMLLSAEQGYGKTFLCAGVIADLVKRNSRTLSKDSISRVIVGYYYLQAHDTKAVRGQDEELLSVDKILKTLAMQFAQDPVYRKFLASTCEDWTEPEDLDQLFSTLLDYCYKGTETYYIIIDGIDRAGEKQLRGLASMLKATKDRFTPVQRAHVRILMSGRQATMREMSQLLSEASLVSKTLDVGSRSAPDVAKFVQDQMDGMSLLKGDTDQIKKLRQEIFTSLTTSTDGDFVNLGLLLKEISSKVWPAEIRQVLASATGGAQRSDTIAREVTRCNNTLSAQEIRDLNVLLLWVMCARRTLRVSELDAVLYLANGETPLRSLREQIMQKYSAFFHVDPAHDAGSDSGRGWLVSLSSDSIRQYFTDSAKHTTQSHLESTKIQEAEVKIVRRFLSSVCDEELYSKFGFDEFFSEKLSNSTTFIHVDIESAACSILIDCLRALTHGAEETTELRGYAMNYFPRHMTEIDLSLTSPVLKTEVGRHLIAAFTKSEVITRWWPPVSNVQYATKWWFTDENCDLVVNYFRDSAVAKSFSDDERAWIGNLTSKSSPDSDVLQHIAMTLTKQLCVISAWNLKLLFSCIYAYRRKLAQRREPSFPRISGQLKKYQVSAQDIVDFFTWLAGVNNMPISTDYEWNRALARMFRQYDYLDEAIAQYQIAIGLTNDPWFAQYGLGSALQDKDEFAAAVEMFELVEKQIVDGRAVSNDPRTYLRQVRSWAAWCYRQLWKLDEALMVYDKHLQEDDSFDYGFTWEKMRVLYFQHQFDKIIELLREIHSTNDPYFGIRRTSRLLHWVSDSGDLEFILIEAARETQSRDYLRQLFKEAVDDAYNPSYLVDYPSLRAEYRVNMKWFLSEEMWRAARTNEQKAETISYWEDLVTDASDVGVSFVYAGVAKRLSEAYIERMRGHQPDAEESKALSRRITDLAIEDTTQQDAWTSTVNSSLLVARYFSSLGHIEEARKLARGSVKIGLDLLSDEDPENDWEAYIRLAHIFMYCGEDQNALAAWSRLWPKQALSGKAESPIENGNTTEDARLDGDISYFCDGFCGREWTYGSDIYVCKDCLDVMFCEKCLGLLRKNELVDNVCSPKHEHLYVPPFDMNEAKMRGRHQVRLEGAALPVHEWLDRIRQDWGLGQGVVEERVVHGRTFSNDWEERERVAMQSAEGEGVHEQTVKTW